MEKTISKYSNRGLERLARAVRVLSSNTKWRLSSSYTVIECHDKEEAVTWLGKEFNLFKNRAMYLGSTICEMCFQEGRLNYEACHLHTNCTHHFYNETCIACTSTTLAGYWYERLKTLQDKNILEVIEESRASHSAQRSVPDEERERQIHEVFPCIGFVYVTVAHTKHDKAHADDVFFTKQGEEYVVMESKLETWSQRIDDVRDALISLYDGKKNETIKLGY